jgi:hypothetical protein
MRAPCSLPGARLVWTSSESLQAPWARACFGCKAAAPRGSAAKLITRACSRVRERRPCSRRAVQASQSQPAGRGAPYEDRTAVSAQNLRRQDRRRRERLSRACAWLQRLGTSAQSGRNRAESGSRPAVRALSEVPANQNNRPCSGGGSSSSSSRFTRERTLVRNQPRPSRKVVFAGTSFVGACGLGGRE